MTRSGDEPRLGGTPGPDTSDAPMIGGIQAPMIAARGNLRAILKLMTHSQKLRFKQAIVRHVHSHLDSFFEESVRPFVPNWTVDDYGAFTTAVRRWLNDPSPENVLQDALDLSGSLFGNLLLQAACQSLGRCIRNGDSYQSSHDARGALSHLQAAIREKREITRIDPSELSKAQHDSYTSHVQIAWAILRDQEPPSLELTP